MNRATIAIVIPLGMSLSIVLFLALLLLSCSDTISHRFDTHADLAKSSLIEKKMAPIWLPELATDIKIHFDFDLNIVSGQARYEFAGQDDGQEEWLIGLTAVNPLSVDRSVVRRYGSETMFYSDGTFLIAVDRRLNSIGWTSFRGIGVQRDSVMENTGKTGVRKQE